MITNINFSNDLFDYFSIRPTPPTPVSDLLDISLIFPAIQETKEGFGITKITIDLNSKANIVNSFVSSLRETDLGEKEDVNWKAIRDNQIIPQMNAHYFWRQCEEDIMNSVRRLSRKYYQVLFSGMPQLESRGPLVNACIGPNPALLVATGTAVDKDGNEILDAIKDRAKIHGYLGGDRKCEIHFNPQFFLRVALDFYFYYRDKFDNFRDAFIYASTFIFIHEAQHCSRGHFSKVDKTLMALEKEAGGMSTISKVTDMAINLDCAKILKSLVKGEVLIPVGLYTTQVEFFGSPHPKNFNKPADFESIFSPGFPTRMAPAMECKYDPNCLVMMRAQIGVDVIENVFNNNFILYLNFMRSLRDYFLVDVARFDFAMEGEKKSLASQLRFGGDESYQSGLVSKNFSTKNNAALTGKTSCEPSDIVDFYAQLSDISGLRLSELLPVTVEDSDDHELLHELLLRQIELWPDTDNPNEEQSEEWPRAMELRQVGFSITDVLGTYNSRTHHVTMYVNLIKATAQSLGVSYQTLYEIVLTHEISHAITHLAYDEDGKIWEWFAVATSESKELLAQLLPFILFRDCEMTAHTEAMEKLSSHQTNKYNDYKEYAGASVGEIRTIVEQKRKHLKLTRTSAVAFQVDYKFWSPFQRGGVHVFEDGRVLGCYDEVVDSAENYPFEENWISKSSCDELPKRVSEETLEELKRASRHIMGVGEEEFCNGPDVVLDSTIETLKITFDGFTRTFTAIHPGMRQAWGDRKYDFESLLALKSKAVEEASE